MKKMYTILIMTVLAMGNAGVRAQSFSEWFRQKKTQKKYLLAQIAALETYLKLVEKGYHVAQDGLSAITNLKSGDFMQHVLHFKSLKMVSPAVKNYSKVLAIAEMEDKSEQFRHELLSGKGLKELLNAREFRSLNQLYNDAGEEGKKDLEELELLVTDGQLKMTDDERISRIDQLYIEVKTKLREVLILGRQVQALMTGRRELSDDSRLLEQLYGK